MCRRLGWRRDEIALRRKGGHIRNEGRWKKVENCVCLKLSGCCSSRNWIISDHLLVVLYNSTNPTSKALLPRWPSGKTAAPGPQGFWLETRFHRRSAVYGACGTPNHPQCPNVLPLVWRRSLERGCHVRCRPHHLTMVQNGEVRPKIALVLLQNRTLI
ncbi:hypothetical protein AVEN_55420-1 [Araneus ventricosus]|uniref:Uncharacterized protein n=1 Tax=Araneus ventricosus TaxID=182803 RepID=A0A4Y2PT55_ARAVE|nr:hypothetical protein AVEN_55420-1 [Araneus ventricosus]